MKLVVTDVSVFFDLFAIKLLPEFFALDWEIITTDIVYNEIIQQNQKSEFEVFVRSHRLISTRKILHLFFIYQHIS